MGTRLPILAKWEVTFSIAIATCVRYTSQNFTLGRKMLTQGSFSSSTSLRSTLRDAVERSSLPRQTIAERAGISRRALYSMLEGQADPRLSTIESLSHVLGLDLLIAPKAVGQLRLSMPSTGRLSEHSRVRRLLERGHLSKA